MELELSFTELAHCESVGQLSCTQEESMETAIPEYCPDISRIVDTVGQLRLREKHLAGAQLTVSGSVRLTVLYTSEESSGLRSLSMELPFTCRMEDKRLSGCCSVCVSGRLLLAEARAVTARKLYLRVMPEFTAEGYVRRSLRLCSGAGEDPALRLRRQELELELLLAAEERELSFTLELPPQGDSPEELLLERVQSRITGCQQVGSRLVVKGEADCSVLYRTAEQPMAAQRVTVPFSQLMEGLELPEGAQLSCDIASGYSEARLLRTEDGPVIGIAMTLQLLLEATRRQQLSCVDDLYSLHSLTRVRRQELTLPVEWQQETALQEAVQQLEFGPNRPFAFVTAADCTATTALEGGGATLRAELRLRVLYPDESGTPVCTERSAEAEVPLSWQPQSLRVSCGQPRLQFTGATCRLSLPLRFQARSWQRRSCAAISAVELEEPPREEAVPSLVLRRLAPGESLWDLARQYRSDTEAICAVNELTDRQPEGLLLIPRIR